MRGILELSVKIGLLLSLAVSPITGVSISTNDRFSVPESDALAPGCGIIRRYKWFQYEWRQRRTAWESRLAKDQQAVVFLGDSITARWETVPRNFFPDVKIANRGISGDTTRGVLFRLGEDVLRLNPRGVVLLIGANDIEEGVSPKMIGDNYRLILRNMTTALPDMPIVVCLLMPSSEKRARPAKLIRETNEQIARVCVDFPRVKVLDTWSIFLNAIGGARADEFPDFIHPNDVGYARWAKALRVVFNDLNWVVAL